MTAKISALRITLMCSAAALAACSAAPSSSGGSHSLPAAQGSWISHDALSQPLLYVSNSEKASVNVYSGFLSKHPTLEGQLTGFEYPYGACVDAMGNVYVTDEYAVDVVEYAHGGSTPLKTLPLAGLPIGCAVDPVTGNLAVSIYEGSQGGNTRGGVFIFSNASGTPTLYTDPDLWQIWPPAYDPKGNLFVLGYNPTVELAELPRGGSEFEQISLGVQLNAPGSVLWDGRYLDAVDQQYQGGTSTAIYRITVSGTTGTIHHTTVLSDTCNGAAADVVQPLIVGRTVFGPNHACTNRFDYWSDARGGNPRRSMPSAPLDGSGEAISKP
ncbi:MAG TPA: hypothetical protein VKE42_04890 [Candidatus Cybelea sp.]|nr:hypothetical protein [Candidatus Cybelea sp.]